MAVRKFAISFEATLVEKVQQLARAEGLSVSRWLANAAARDVQRARLEEFLRQLDAELGPITDEERADVDRLWPASP
ncbi:MAG: hypothetical protein ACR2HN_01095 [Tepidiformaceae bacterium]